MKKVVFVTLLHFFLLVGLSAIDMIQIPKGSFLMGTTEEYLTLSGTTEDLPDSKYKPHTVELDAFRISKYEISSTQFLEFLKETGKSPFDKLNIYSELISLNGSVNADYPAVSTYLYAMDFCKWLSEKEKKHYRLPTEAEWEYAATGGDGRSYPWGAKYTQLSATELDQWISYEITPREDKSPFGVMNMYGNVAEWVLDYFQFDFYEKSPRKNPVCVDGEQRSINKEKYYPPTYVVRGNNLYHYDLSNIEYPVNKFTGVKIRYPYWHNILEPYIKIGFRIVEDCGSSVFNNDTNRFFYTYSDVIAIDTAIIKSKPKNDSKTVGNVIKGSKLKSSFCTIDATGNRWTRVQTILFDQDISGTKRGDVGIVGWIEQKYLQQ